MNRVVFPNGLTFIDEHKDSDIVTVQVSVFVGSNNESAKILGISHFLEHMILEGSKKRPDALSVANEVESLGGEINAATSNERTYFYVKLPVKHVEVACELLSDVLFNPLFDEATFEKEKRVVLDEINMVNDEPRYFQWILFQSSLFEKHPAKNPVYGTKKTVTSCSVKDMKNYYKKYYKPNNMVVSVVGNVKDAQSTIKKYFGSQKKKLLPSKVRFTEPAQLSKKTITKKKDVVQSYVVLGYKTVKRSDPDSYVLDVIRGVLGRGQSGRLFDEIRSKRGLAYEVGVHHEPALSYGFFSVYYNTAKKNVSLVQDIVLEEFEKLKNISDSDLEDAKTFIEGEFLVSAEDSQHFADYLSFWHLVGDAFDANRYVSRIKKVTKDDVKRVINKYFTKNFTVVVIG